MTFIAAPAVDLRGGRCVQLVGGRPEDERVSLPDAVAVARGWWEQGFRTLHVVDLDAALGRGDNRDLVARVLAATPATTQVGGGVRDDAGAQALLDAGAPRVVVGTRAVDDPDWLERLAARHPGRVMVAADVRGGRVLRRGWTEEAALAIDALLARLAPLPLAGVLCTDVAREGRMEGIDAEAARAVVEASAHPVWISGGLTTVADLESVEAAGARGAVLGMALYTGRLDAAEVAARWGTGDAGASRAPASRTAPSRTPPTRPPETPLSQEGRAMSRLRRDTRETQITVAVGVAGGVAAGGGERGATLLGGAAAAGAGARSSTGAAPPSRIRTTDPFLTHMVETLARYAGLAIELDAKGDLRHHLVEDVAITLGLALADEVPEEAVRYGWAVVPMDDALVQAAVDVGGRPWYEGRLPSPLYEHFLQSLAVNLEATLHVRVLRGRDRHHVVEAAVKAVGLALRQALRRGEAGEVFSTKGRVRVQREDPA